MCNIRLKPCVNETATTKSVCDRERCIACNTRLSRVTNDRFQDVRDTVLSVALAVVLTRQRSSVILRSTIEFAAFLLTPGFSPVQPTLQEANRFNGFDVKESRKTAHWCIACNSRLKPAVNGTRKPDPPRHRHARAFGSAISGRRDCRDTTVAPTLQ